MNSIKPGDLKYKSEKVYLSHTMVKHDKKLSEIEFWIIEKFGMLVTEAYREKKHINDLHGTIPVRAKDIRSWCYNSPEEVVKAINNEWEYDYARPEMKVAVCHNAGQGIHIHLQAHKNTRKR